MRMGKFVAHSLPSMSENAFRSVYTGRLNKDLETSMEINTLLRTRQDLKIQIQYIPNDIGFNDIYVAGKNAKAAADLAERMRLRQLMRNDI